MNTTMLPIMKILKSKQIRFFDEVFYHGCFTTTPSIESLPVKVITFSFALIF